jgi:hypothetical protein
MVADFCHLVCVTPGHGPAREEGGFSVVSGGRSMWLSLIYYSSSRPA